MYDHVQVYVCDIGYCFPPPNTTDLSDHYKVVTFLRKLDNRQIRYVGGALGLAYNTLDKMRDVPLEMVAAWLRREDSVMAASGEPTWRSLVNAVRKEGLEGTARDIELGEWKPNTYTWLIIRMKHLTTSPVAVYTVFMLIECKLKK